MPVERDLVPEEPLAVLIGLGKVAGGDLVTEAFDSQADIGGRRFLRIGPHDGAVPLETLRSPNPAGDMWVTQAYPADFNWSEDRAKIKVGLHPPQNGTIFRIVDFVPTTAKIDQMPIDTMMKVAGDSAPKRGLPPKHPMMHRTRTVDYAIILAGEIDMMMDDSTVHLKAGDVVVQQATNHAWINRSGAPCRVAFILMDSREP